MFFCSLFHLGLPEVRLQSRSNYFATFLTPLLLKSKFAFIYYLWNNYEANKSFRQLYTVHFVFFIGFVGGNPDAKRLYDDLLSNYNKLVRPVVNVTDAVMVRLKLKLSQLIDVVSMHALLI